MKQYKLKEPVIILDEPEISLHQVMVDRMMENIFAMSGKVQFLMSTHSPRCMKMMLEREETDFGIYHVVLKDRYTRLAKVKNLAEEETRERAVITEAYTNSCFARMVVSVEGETELEVLKNKYLRSFFLNCGNLSCDGHEQCGNPESRISGQQKLSGAGAFGGRYGQGS